MKTTGIFQTHYFAIKQCVIRQPVFLIFFGDIHRDSPHCADGRWREFLDYCQDKQKRDRCYYFGMGDYLDGFSTSERSILAENNLHESSRTNVEAMQDGMVKLLAKEMRFMEGRLIGLLNGNHYTNFQDGTNSDQRLCRELGCKFLGVQAFVRVSFEYSKPGNHNTRSLDLLAHHGKGAARLTGSSFNTVEQMLEYADADLLAMGHDHKRGIIPGKPQIFLFGSKDQLRVNERERYLIRSGSFLKTFVPGEASYNVDAARGPCSLGHVEVEITPMRDNPDDGMRLAVRGIS